MSYKVFLLIMVFCAINNNFRLVAGNKTIWIQVFNVPEDATPETDVSSYTAQGTLLSDDDYEDKDLSVNTRDERVNLMSVWNSLATNNTDLQPYYRVSRRPVIIVNSVVNDTQAVATMAQLASTNILTNRTKVGRRRRPLRRPDYRPKPINYRPRPVNYRPNQDILVDVNTGDDLEPIEDFQFSLLYFRDRIQSYILGLRDFLKSFFLRQASFALRLKVMVTIGLMIIPFLTASTAIFAFGPSFTMFFALYIPLFIVVFVVYPFVFLANTPFAQLLLQSDDFAYRS